MKAVSRLLPALLLVVTAIAADQWVKHLVETRMAYHEQIDLLSFFALFRTHNDGVAFSMLAWLGAGGLLVMNTIIVAFVLWLAWRNGPGRRFAAAGFALIVAGAIGNMIDRALLGYVVDYFLFHTPVWSFAIFNLADVFITLGAGLVILEELLDWLHERRNT